MNGNPIKSNRNIPPIVEIRWAIWIWTRIILHSASIIIIVTDYEQSSRIDCAIIIHKSDNISLLKENQFFYLRRKFCWISMMLKIRHILVVSVAKILSKNSTFYNPQIENQRVACSFIRCTTNYKCFKSDYLHELTEHTILEMIHSKPANISSQDVTEWCGNTK